MTEPYWEPLAAAPPTGAASSVPVGAVLEYAGAAAPSGWLVCNGASLLRADYPLLFAAIGTVYGASDGTHFNLPDCRGRMTVGVNSLRTECDAVGDADNLAVGSRRPQHRHTVTEGGHNHTISDPGHNHTPHDPGHQHNVAVGTTGTGAGNLAVTAAIDSSGYVGDSGGHLRTAYTGYYLDAATTGVGVAYNTTNLTVGNAADYTDAPPFITLNKIIKTD